MTAFVGGFSAFCAEDKQQCLRYFHLQSSSLLARIALRAPQSLRQTFSLLRSGPSPSCLEAIPPPFDAALALSGEWEK